MDADLRFWFADELLPRPPGLDAGAEAWDTFMLTQHERIWAAIRRAEEQARVTRAGQREQNAALYEFRTRLMLSAVKNDYVYKGRVIGPLKKGSAKRTYICELDDIPEALSDIAEEGNQKAAEWLGHVAKVFALKRQQWFTEGRFHINFHDPSYIESAIYSRCINLAEDEASRAMESTDFELAGIADTS